MCLLLITCLFKAEFFSLPQLPLFFLLNSFLCINFSFSGCTILNLILFNSLFKLPHIFFFYPFNFRYFFLLHFSSFCVNVFVYLFLICGLLRVFNFFFQSIIEWLYSLQYIKKNSFISWCFISLKTFKLAFIFIQVF